MPFFDCIGGFSANEKLPTSWFLDDNLSCFNPALFSGDINEKIRPDESHGSGEGIPLVEENEDLDEHMLRMSRFASLRLSSASFSTHVSASRIVLAINRNVSFDANSVISKLPPAVLTRLALLTDITHRGRYEGEIGDSPKNLRKWQIEYRISLDKFFELFWKL